MSSIQTHHRGRAGEVLLDRPRALNALDLPMIRAIAATLNGWRDRPDIHLVIIASASERAFCAGGDIRAVREAAISGDHPAIEAFFAEEYALNLQIATYPKPITALIDGVCMGGGIGLSVHAPYRVVSEHAVLAMPETAIALFPDVGTTYVLPRLPGAVGTWLALTGARLTGADAIHAGLATHYVPRAGFAALREALAADGMAALAIHAAPLPPNGLAEDRRRIDRCFAADDIPTILNRLQGETGMWAATSQAALRAASPSSLVWSLAMVRAGLHRTLPQALAAELDLTRRVTVHPDFIEGVRAMLVDKDRQPRWTPARIEDVDLAEIEAMLPR
jgi:enoyl-CoA hydratase/carnithine racemase